MNIKNVPTWCKISIAIFLMFIYISLVFGVSAFVNGYCNNNNTIKKRENLYFYLFFLQNKHYIATTYREKRREREKASNK